MSYQHSSLRSSTAHRIKLSSLQNQAMIMNDVTDAIIITDLKFSVLTYNKAAESCFSLGSKALEKNMMKVLDYEFLNSSLAAVKKMLDKKGKWSGEVVYRANDGNLFYFNSKLFFTYSAAGKKTAIVSVNSNITDRKLLEAKIRLLDNYTHIVLNSTREAIFLLDTSGNIRNYNEYARQLIKNFTGSDIRVITNLFDAVPKERKVAVIKYISQASKGKLKEYEVKYPDGKWLEVCFFPENNQHGDIQEICCTLKDITERKKNEQRILESEEKYHRVIETMAEGIIFHSIEGKTITSNARAAELLGISKRMISVSGLLNPRIKWMDEKLNHLNFASLFAETIKKEAGFRNKVVGLQKQQTVTWLSMNAEPVKKDRMGIVDGCVFTFTDISSTIRNRENLHLTLKVINETSNLVVITDKQGRITWANNSFVRTSEYSLKEAIGKKPGELLKGNEKDEAEILKISEGIRKQIPVEGEILNYTKTGKKYWVNYNIHPIWDKNGEVVQFFSVQSDITLLKKVQQEMTEKRIEQLRLVANATIKGQEDKQNEIGRELHDNVNQLLAASKMTLAIALKTKRSNKELITRSMEYIQMANDEIRQLTHTLVAPGFKNTSLRSGLEKLISESRTGANINIDTLELTETYIDPTIKLALYRIAQEQLNNIGKYAYASKIDLLAECNQEKVRLYIEDNGVGFDMASINKGIGINNIFNRAESFFGKAKITSSPGHGCKLEVVIPLYKSTFKN